MVAEGSSLSQAQLRQTDRSSKNREDAPRTTRATAGSIRYQ